jgi:hypothetical protein
MAAKTARRLGQGTHRHHASEHRLYLTATERCDVARHPREYAVSANRDAPPAVWQASYHELARLAAFCRGMLIGFCAAFLLFDLCLWQGRITGAVTGSTAYTLSHWL